jgi:hypothetical protein
MPFSHDVAQSTAVITPSANLVVLGRSVSER